jgi:hypothetical protein
VLWTRAIFRNAVSKSHQPPGFCLEPTTRNTSGPPGKSSHSRVAKALPNKKNGSTGVDSAKRTRRMRAFPGANLSGPGNRPLPLEGRPRSSCPFPARGPSGGRTASSATCGHGCSEAPSRATPNASAARQTPAEEMQPPRMRSTGVRPEMHMEEHLLSHQVLM